VALVRRATPPRPPGGTFATGRLDDVPARVLAEIPFLEDADRVQGQLQVVLHAEKGLGLAQPGVAEPVEDVRFGEVRVFLSSTSARSTRSCTCSTVGTSSRHPAFIRLPDAFGIPRRRRRVLRRRRDRPLDLTRFEADAGRTCYVLDVRDPAEFIAGHRPGSLSAPGGQLVQPPMAGSVCARPHRSGGRRRGAGAHGGGLAAPDGPPHVFVVEGGLQDATEPGSAPVGVPELRTPVETIDATRWRRRRTPRWWILARQHRLSRRPHSRCAVGGCVAGWMRSGDPLAAAGLVVLTSPDGTLARLAVAEVKALTRARCACWRAATDRLGPAPRSRCGAAARTRRMRRAIDFYLRPYDRNSGIEKAMRGYLSWEIDLVREIERDGTVAFGMPEPA